MDAPDMPDPKATAQAQAESNKETAITQAELGQYDINAPGGTIKYNLIGYNPDGTPKYEQVQTLSPEQQQLYDLQNQGLTNIGKAGVAQSQKVADLFSTPFDLSAARGKELTDIQQKYLDPVWKTKEDQLRTQLINSGYREGDEGWTTAMNNLADQRNRAYDSMFLDAYQTANNAALQERELPLTELNTLLRGPTAAAPTAATPTPGVAPVDYTSLVENLYKSQMAGYTGELGAIGSALGAVGTAVGGWAGGGFKTASDRRVKTDVELVGIDPRGWGIYLFRYIWDRVRQLGYMADEVAIVRPDAVERTPGGFLVIDYGALNHAS